MVPIEISTARYVFNSRLSSRYLISTNILPSLRYRTYSSQPSSPGVRYQEQYKSPRLPIVFAHGLFGFDELSFAPARFRDSFPQLSIAYWRGVSVLLRERGVDLHVAKVPMSASIEERAQALRQVIDSKFAGRDVNVIGHSMGGLDARFLLSRLSCKAKIRSLTTIATPHRGSPFADFMLDNVIGRHRLPHLLKLLQRLGLPGGGRAFECLTTTEMSRFNRETPDNPQANYLSWGAAFKPGMFNEFYYPHRVIAGVEVSGHFHS